MDKSIRTQAEEIIDFCKKNEELKIKNKLLFNSLVKDEFSAFYEKYPYLLTNLTESKNNAENEKLNKLFDLHEKMSKGEITESQADEEFRKL